MEDGQPQSSARATVTSKTLSVTLWTSRRPWLQHHGPTAPRARVWWESQGRPVANGRVSTDTPPGSWSPRTGREE